MLRGIDPLLGPELLQSLRAMGHGDEIAIVDANYPATADAQRLVRLEGVPAVPVLHAVLSVLPLDSFVDCPAWRMEVAGAPDEVPEIVAEFERVVEEASDSGVAIGALERFAFYERVRTAFVVVATGERRLYGNILLKKGILQPKEGPRA